jgi:glycosyltransferase involved in cell wall biosynthesis
VTRVLVVSWAHPPVPSVGGNRWLAMAKYLRRAGHEVDVLTTAAYGALPDDGALGVHRAPDLIANERLRTLLRRPAIAEPGAPAPVDTPPPAALMKLLVPDPYVVSWLPAAIRLARRLHRRRPYDCVVTTSAYESAHLVALGLGSRRPAWVADFRDGWTFEPWKPDWPTAAQRRLEGWLERTVVTTAERVVVVERPVAEDFRARYGVEAAFIPNGWDPDLDADADGATPPALDPERVNLVHTGKLSGGWGRSPAVLLDALADLAREQPRLADRLRLVLAGRLDRAEQELIADRQLGDLVRHVGHLTRAESMALQRGADVLVLITSADLSWELPGKLFEYLGARRPVLALAEGNEAARMVRETDAGWTVPPGDRDAVRHALARLAEGERPPVGEAGAVTRLCYPGPAEAVAREIELAIAARR